MQALPVRAACAERGTRNARAPLAVGTRDAVDRFGGWGLAVFCAEDEAALGSVIQRLAEAREPGFACTPEGDRFRLEIWGSFTPDWCGSLSLQCYAAKLSVVSGEARRMRASYWAGRFLLANAGNESVERLDFVRMAAHRPKALLPPGEVAIDELRIEPSRSSGAAGIRLTAPDRLGFLAFVLHQFAFCGLYPHSLVLRTSPDGRIDDWFEVFGVGGTPPSERALGMLSTVLAPAPHPPS